MMRLLLLFIFIKLPFAHATEADQLNGASLLPVSMIGSAIAHALSTTGSKNEIHAIQLTMSDVVTHLLSQDPHGRSLSSTNNHLKEQIERSDVWANAGIPALLTSLEPSRTELANFLVDWTLANLAFHKSASLTQADIAKLTNALGSRFLVMIQSLHWNYSTASLTEHQTAMKVAQAMKQISDQLPTQSPNLANFTLQEATALQAQIHEEKWCFSLSCPIGSLNWLMALPLALSTVETVMATGLAIRSIDSSGLEPRWLYIMAASVVLNIASTYLFSVNYQERKTLLQPLEAWQQACDQVFKP